MEPCAPSSRRASPLSRCRPRSSSSPTAAGRTARSTCRRSGWPPEMSPPSGSATGGGAFADASGGNPQAAGADFSVPSSTSRPFPGRCGSRAFASSESPPDFSCRSTSRSSQPGPDPDDPCFYVTELYGTIKVVTRTGTSSRLRHQPAEFQSHRTFPGLRGEGLAGIVVDPATGDVLSALSPQSASRRPPLSQGSAFPQQRWRPDRGHADDHPAWSVSKGNPIRSSNLDDRARRQAVLAQRRWFRRFHRAEYEFLSRQDSAVRTSTARPRPTIRSTTRPMGSTPGLIFASASANPFGGAWRASDGKHYEVENGPSVDRFAQSHPGDNYLWDGSDASMHQVASTTGSPPPRRSTSRSSSSRHSAAAVSRQAKWTTPSSASRVPPGLLAHRASAKRSPSSSSTPMAIELAGRRRWSRTTDRARQPLRGWPPDRTDCTSADLYKDQT